jgi:hypothetical protein
MRATESTSPFLRELERIRGMAVGFEKCRVQRAVARRVVGDLWAMGTMCAVPWGVVWVRVCGGGGAGLEDVE